MFALGGRIALVAVAGFAMVLPARAQSTEADAPAAQPLPSAVVSPVQKRSGLNLWSPEREFALGQKLDQELRANTELIDDPAVTAYVAEVARRVAANSGIRLPVELRVIATAEPDSFSLPGGFLYITAGMVEETQSEAELAAVLAHEVAHIACRYPGGAKPRADVARQKHAPSLIADAENE